MHLRTYVCMYVYAYTYYTTLQTYVYVRTYIRMYMLNKMYANMYVCRYAHNTCTVRTLIANSLISSIAILLFGPDPNAFSAVTTTLTSLSIAGKSNVAIRLETEMDPFVIFCPK